MRTALETNTWYCHAFCKIPKVQLVCPEGLKDGHLEQELFQIGEKTPMLTTSRQMALDNKKKGITYSLSARSTKDKSGTVDFETSEGQSKVNGQLSTIFNILDNETNKKLRIQNPELETDQIEDKVALKTSKKA